MQLFEKIHQRGALWAVLQIFEFNARKSQKCYCPSVETPESEFTPYPAVLLTVCGYKLLLGEAAIFLSSTICPQTSEDHLNARAVSETHHRVSVDCAEPVNSPVLRI